MTTNEINKINKINKINTTKTTPKKGRKPDFDSARTGMKAYINVGSQGKKYLCIVDNAGNKEYLKMVI